MVAVSISGVLLWNLRNSSEAKAARARRILLLDRAEGRISREEFEERQAALDSILLDRHAEGSGWPIVAVVIGAGVITAVIFSWLGSSASVTPVQTQSSQSPGVTLSSSVDDQLPPKQGGDLRNLAKPLAEKLATNPNDGAGWLLLARTYVELHQFKEAEAAFEKASKLVAADAQMLVDWAGTQVSANNGMWTPAARDILKKALALDPNYLKGLTLAIAEAESRNDNGQATIYRKQIAKVTASGAVKSIESESSQMDARPGTSSAKLPMFPTQRRN